jgi:membrane protein implicated in regulation of membrane protease activity
MDDDVDMNLLLSPPIAFIFFLVLLFFVYVLIQRYAAKGLDHPDKHLPYSGGQKLPPTEVRLSYETFFRLGLLFGIAHVAVLVLATLPLNWSSQWLGLLYLVGISISAVVLARTRDE